jgi:hypothetical protein
MSKLRPRIRPLQNVVSKNRNDKQKNYNYERFTCRLFFWTKLMNVASFSYYQVISAYVQHTLFCTQMFSRKQNTAASYVVNYMIKRK